MNRLFRAGPGERWQGRCEVILPAATHYIHHNQWPERSTYKAKFAYPENLKELIADQSWVEVVTDPDLQMDEGL